MIYICGYCRPEKQWALKVKAEQSHKPRGAFVSWDDLIEHLIVQHRFKANRETGKLTR